MFKKDTDSRKGWNDFYREKYNLALLIEFLHTLGYHKANYIV